MRSNEAKLERRKKDGVRQSQRSQLYTRSLSLSFFFFKKFTVIEVFREDVKIGLEINNIIMYV